MDPEDVSEAHTSTRGKRARILVVDFPYPDRVKSSYRFLDNLLTILREIGQDVQVCSGNIHPDSDEAPGHSYPIRIRTHFLHEMSPRWLSAIRLLVTSVLIQAQICANIVRVAKSVDVVIFFMMHAHNEAAPMLLAKMMGVTVVKVPLSLAPRERIRASSLCGIAEMIVHRFADYFVPEYESTVECMTVHDLAELGDRVLPPAHFFLLEDDFRAEVPYPQRGDVVGYIGGFRDIKGIRNFVQAAEIVIAGDDSVKIFIAGDGTLRDEIHAMVRRLPQDRIELLDWIPHDRMAHYLNRLKLLVVPSYSETGPFVAIESMACGTPILATSVGVIPRIVVHGINGFMLSSNDPNHIAERILQVFCEPITVLAKVSEESRMTIERKYGLEGTKADWARVINQLWALDGWGQR